MPLKIHEVLRMLKNDGWILIGFTGSHRQFEHPQKPGRVTIAGKRNDDISPGTLKSILRQAQIERPRQ